VRVALGHLDKQPEFTGWLRVWGPGSRDPEGKLYGRAPPTTLRGVQLAHGDRRAEGAAGAPARCLVLIEACEESGKRRSGPRISSPLGATLGEPSLVVCLDAECGNYDQVWCTTSLRGNLLGTLRVRVLTEGVHSGMATGIAPTRFAFSSSSWPVSRARSPAICCSMSCT